MPRFAFPRSARWSLLVVAAGWCLAAGALSGCPGSLDPSIMEPPQTGSGGTTGGGSGGSTGSGGSMNVDCSGSNAGDQIIMSTCAAVCHNAGADAVVGGSLDLTVDSSIKSRLVGMMSAGGPSSMCGGNKTAYLNANSNPATGLLIDKINLNPVCPQNSECCGTQMPQGASLTATQFECIRQWATGLTTGTSP